MSVRQIVLFILFFVCNLLQAQEQFAFTPIDCKNGLSENMVRNIVQLPDGRLVISTEGVTNIYDGTAFKHLHLKNENTCQLTGYFGFQHGYVDEDRVWMKNFKQLAIIDIKREIYFNNPDSVIRSLGVQGSLADFFLDAQGNQWFRTSLEQLLLRKVKANKPTLFIRNSSLPLGKKEDLLDIATIQDKAFLFYKSGLVMCYELKTGKELYHFNSFSQDHHPYNTLMVVQSERSIFQLWNGNSGGCLIEYDLKTQKTTTLLKTSYWLNTLSIDKNANLWVSCQKGIWLIDRYLKDKQFISSFKVVDGTVINTEASTQCNDAQGGLWIGTFNHGLLYYHADRFKFRNIGKVFFQSNEKDLNVMGFAESKPGFILVNTTNGLYEYDIQKNKLNAIRDLDRPHLFESNTSGRIAPMSSTFRSIIQPILERIKNYNKQYNCMFVDSHRSVWIGTQDGLIVWHKASNRVEVLFSDEGLVNNSIKGVQEDASGKIWVTTAGGVSCISVNRSNTSHQYSIANFNHLDGVIGNEFINQSIFRSQQGYVLMGGVNGFNIIDPTKHWVSIQLGKPIFTNLTIFGTVIKSGVSYQGNVLLKQAMATTRRIVLKHQQNFFSIDFTALNYVNPTQTYYRYRLEGVDNDWREIVGSNGSGRASYTNLAPGTYHLRVKAANNSRVWSNAYAELELVIKPPYWKTPLAYICYFILVISLIYVLLSYYKRLSHQRINRKNEEKLNEMKFSFFTNVSHEFRTPLTLIITPLESLLKEVKDTPFAPKINTVYQHSLNLLHLVNQLLDFRRLEITGEKLNLTFGNLVEFIQLFEEQFEKLAQEKQIRFAVVSNEPELYLYFDKDKMFKIVNNLLSNAFKFTSKGGRINVQISTQNGQVQLSVTDTGTGISPNDLPHLFDRFYQASNVQGGSGIGLHLVKGYVQLHRGEISVESIPNMETRFTITIPTTLAPSTFKEIPLNTETQVASVTPLESKEYTILVVEDHEDLRGFIVSELSKTYRVIDAPDGASGVDLAQSELPNLIISDVLMPKMNGLELCRAIKSNLQTSHIPLILLTARSSEEHKIEGYYSGADEYLSKPFSMDLLLVRIAHLIELETHRKKQFSQKIQVNPKEITITSIDEQLIQKALNCIEKNMDNPEYSVQQFSLDLNMDRTVLYKKLQSLTGLSPSDFIRSIRLKRAALLLQKGQLPVNEVADKVGFNSTKYFTKYFKEAFGVTPSLYAKSKGGNNEMTLQ